MLFIKYIRDKIKIFERKGEKRMKRIIVLGIIIFLVLIIVGSAYAEQKHFKGYGGIETWTDNNKLTIKIGDCEFTVIILPKKFTREESFAFHCWVGILGVHLAEDMEVKDKIKAVEEIQYFVEILAARIKTGKMDSKDVSINPKDVQKALKVFWGMFFVAADRIVGNDDGFCSDAETYKLEMSLQSRVVAMMNY